MTGRFITLEGGEGAGKSTQIKHLAAALEAAGRAVVTTREPGGSPGAEEIRALVVSGAPDRWDPPTEALLMFAARRDHVERLIKPALARGDWVLCDRFTDSTSAYQGEAHGLGRDWVRRLAQEVLGDFSPDLTLIFDLPVEDGLKRAGRRGGEDRFERMATGFHQRLRDGFLAIAAEEPERCAVIDAGRSETAVAASVRQTVAARLPDSGLGA
ncbi:MAG: dTMP kinase [Marivibrio sp.]|uniref:dTMP kinase n=1 Tax=Marivibrio sp. TaxID=2039719 RepID=UPI0032ED3B19